MNLMGKLGGVSGLRIALGSGCLWSWFDALFMGAFFFGPNHPASMPEGAVLAAYACVVAFLASALFLRQAFIRLLSSAKALMFVALAGSIGSCLFAIAGLAGTWPLLAVGGVLSGLFLAVFQLGWGAAYCQQGTRSAVPFVAAGFACAAIIDIPLLLMVPLARAIFFALLPLCSGLLIRRVNPLVRSFGARESSPNQHVSGARDYLTRYLGISLLLLAALALIKFGFGYMQHLMSFSSLLSGPWNGGVIIQVARGAAALALLAVVVKNPAKTSSAYRIGLLAMIAGFMAMPFLFEMQSLWMSGVVIIVGYTTFDLFSWVAFSQIAYDTSRSRFQTIAFMRLVSSTCSALGIAVGLVLVGSGETLNRFVPAATTAIGYMVVIATVLLMSSKDVWSLFGMPLVAFKEPLANDPAEAEGRDLEFFHAMKYTERESEIAVLLIQGRTQPWIAEHLTISEHTVNTHVRHLYQKAQVHTRQEWIDTVLKWRLSDASLESGESIT